MKSVCAVVGAQYGSEGKGVIVHHLAGRYGVHVRVGGPNAGHSFVHDGVLWKMRSLPCGWTNPDAWLIIGPGALVDLDLLEDEIQDVERFGTLVRGRLLVDFRAGVIEPDDKKAAVESGSQARYGSTQEGVGPARVRKLARYVGKFRRVSQLRSTLNFGVADTSVFLKGFNGDVLLEGTQGCHLSLTTGPWPFTTSQDTNVAQLLSDSGVAPGRLTDVILVARTFPIRVGGNSGPMAGKEISWEELSALRHDGKILREFTTVTGRVRRVCEWADSLLWEAIWLNAPTALALTFLDYWFPRMEGCSSWTMLSPEAKMKVLQLEREFRVPIKYVGTGGESFSIIERDVSVLDFPKAVEVEA